MGSTETRGPEGPEYIHHGALVLRQISSRTLLGHDQNGHNATQKHEHTGQDESGEHVGHQGGTYQGTNRRPDRGPGSIKGGQGSAHT